ncbi:MAG: glycosyltransferase [Duncaniella sp.]|nr:glycosyltransferase [Duncaniella sp.]
MPFSVLISIYAKEQPAFFKESLDSILNQSCRPNEIVLIKDGPLTKDLETIITEYRDNPIIKIISLPQNQGLGKALNIGLNHCSYDLVARMDTDDISKPNRFERQIDYMVNHPEIAVCGSWIEEFEDSTDNVLSVKKVPQTHEEISRYIKSRNPLNHPSVIFRKSAVQSVGGYKHFPLFEDWYLWARMFANGAQFANIQESLLYFRTSKDMYKRRGGLKYAKDSAKFQWTLHKLGIISVPAALKSSMLRGLVYLMPNGLRKLIYSKFLRS